MGALSTRRFDEIVFAQANAFALLFGGEMKYAVLLNGDLRGERAVAARFERDVRAGVDFDQAVGKRTVGGDGELGGGAGDGAQVTAGIFDDVFGSQPARENDR